MAHVEGGVDPLRDAELIETELLLADIGALERRVDGLTKRVRGGDAEARRQLALIEQIRPAMEAGTPARRLRLDAEQRATLQSLQLLTAKPLLYLCNVDEASAASGNAWSDAVAAWAQRAGCAGCVVLAAAIEAEIAALADHERGEYLAALGLERPGLDRVIQAGYGLLDLITFLTAGPKEARAWPIRRGTTARRGRRHDPQRLPARLHLRRGDPLPGLSALRWRGRRARGRPDAPGGARLRRRGRRRGPFRFNV